MPSVSYFILDQDKAYEHPSICRVFVEDEFKFALDPGPFGSVEGCLEMVREHLATLRADGLREFDMTIWQDCRIIAVIRNPRDAEPVITAFPESFINLGSSHDSTLPEPIRSLLLTIIDERHVDRWRVTPLPALGGQTPDEVIRSGQTEGLMQLLRRAGGG